MISHDEHFLLKNDNKKLIHQGTLYTVRENIAARNSVYLSVYWLLQKMVFLTQMMVATSRKTSCLPTSSSRLLQEKPFCSASRSEPRPQPRPRLLSLSSSHTTSDPMVNPASFLQNICRTSLSSRHDSSCSETATLRGCRTQSRRCLGRCLSLG